MGMSGKRNAAAASRERAPSTRWIEIWVGIRAGINTEDRGKSFPSAGIEHRSSSL
jgi:hypothetical protein